MDRYEKSAEWLIKRGDAIISERKRKAAIIRRVSFSVSGLCAAIIVGVGIWHNSSINTPPEMAHMPESNIIITTTVSDEVTTHPRVTVSSSTKSVNVTTTQAISTSAAISKSTETKQPAQTSQLITTKTIITELTEPAIAETTTTIGGSPTNPDNNPSVQNYYLKFKDAVSGIQYTNISGNISADHICESLGKQVITAKTENGEISSNAELFSIKDISSDAMIAVKLEGNDSIYIYNNQEYMPKTLGDFINALGIEQYAAMNSAEYSDFSNGYELRNYYGFDTELIINTLMDKSDAVCYKYSDLPMYKVTPKINIICDMNEIVPLKAGFGISQKGYLTTNLTGGGLGFYIGEDKATEVIDKIVNSYPYSVFSVENDNVNSG